MATINYVILSYFGPRRSGGPIYERDRCFYLDVHLRQLAKVEHSLAQITVVVSGSEEGSARSFIENLPPVIRATPVVVFRTDNAGLSYGAFSRTYARCGGRFSHYFFAEDDYVPTKDGFDGIFLQRMNRAPGCGFVCLKVYDNPKHAAVFQGLFSNEALASVAAVKGELISLRSNKYVDAEQVGQVGFSQSLLQQGYEIIDFGEDYAVPFNTTDGSVVSLAGGGHEPLFVPVQGYFDEKRGQRTPEASAPPCGQQFRGLFHRLVASRLAARLMGWATARARRSSAR